MKQTNFFWVSYSDLMTSLFFIMMVLFVVTIGYLQSEKEKIAKEKMATEKQLQKIQELEEFYKNIDTTYFEYNIEHKKHILKIPVRFNLNSANINDIPENTQKMLIAAGKTIRDSIKSGYKRWNAKCLLIVEGQASNDAFKYNYELSYFRALSLLRLWTANRVKFDSTQCDVIISGSGKSGALRIKPDNATNAANQRFLIHIIPKPGIITNK